MRARAALDDATVACVFIHEDLDACDGADSPTVHKRVQNALNDCLDTAHYVLAVWEIEAWLMLFPEALSAITSSWRVPAKYRNKDTGMLSDPKRILTNEIGKSGRRYRESDAPAIFEKVVALNAQEKPNGSNKSWDKLRHDAQQCCAEHL